MQKKQKWMFFPEHSVRLSRTPWTTTTKRWEENRINCTQS